MKKTTNERAKLIVREVILAWKPFAWASDDPSDPEFDGEIKAIVKQVSRMKSAKATAAVIARVFASSFRGSTDKFTPAACEAVGKEPF